MFQLNRLLSTDKIRLKLVILNVDLKKLLVEKIENDFYITANHAMEREY